MWALSFLRASVRQLITNDFPPQAQGLDLRLSFAQAQGIADLDAEAGVLHLDNKEKIEI